LSKDKNSFFVDSQDGLTNILGIFLKLFFGLPLHIQIHTDFKNPHFSSHSFKNYLHTIGYRAGLFFADYVRVASKRIEKSIGGTRGELYRHPISVQTKSAEPLALKEKFVGCNRFVLTVSRLAPEKDMTTAFRVFAASTEGDADTALIVLGEGSQKGRLMQLSQQLGISERVFFEGWQSPVPYLQCADAFLQTSLYEGYGASLLEAALAKCPIVSTNVGIIGEVLMPSESVVACKQKDIVCLTKGLTTILADDKEAERLAENAYTAAQAHYNEHTQVYQPLLS